MTSATALSTNDARTRRVGRLGGGDPSPGQARVKLSILMPAYNEASMLQHAVASVLSISYPCDFELIVVDDGSTDGTSAVLREINHPNVIVLRHAENLGKGAALQSAAARATGTHLVPFDADLEYDPADLVSMVSAIMTGKGEVVFGPRVLGLNTRYQSFLHAMANRLMTLVANLLFGAYVTDMHTCLKMVPVDTFRSLNLTERGFGLDTEVTAKLLKLGVRPFEVPVTYCSRSTAEGKKITWQDGVKSLQVLARVRVRSRARLRGAQETITRRMDQATSAPGAAKSARESSGGPAHVKLVDSAGGVRDGR
jgi:glycosyl transferase family 2